MSERKKISFVSNTGIAPDPIGKSREAGFQDIILKEPFRRSVIRFRQGITWLRFLPSVQGTQFDWILPMDVYQDIDGMSLAAANTFDRNNVNYFELASNWIRRNRPELAGNKDTNPNGLRLYAKRSGVAWVIEEQAPEGERLRLFKGSLYDGIRGGSTGLAYNIHLEATSRDNEPNSANVGELVYGDITAPSSGRLVKVEKLASAQNEYANYKIGIGKNSAPLDSIMSMLTDEEHNMICPLEEVIHIPTEAEQKGALRRYIGPGVFEEIFGKDTVNVDMGRASTPTPAVKTVEAPEPDEPIRVATPTKAAVAETVAAKVEAPAPAAVETPIATTSAETAVDATTAPYTTREFTKLLTTGEAGLRELIANKARVPKGLLDVLTEEATEAGIAME